MENIKRNEIDSGAENSEMKIHYRGSIAGLHRQKEDSVNVRVYILGQLKVCSLRSRKKTNGQHLRDL